MVPCILSLSLTIKTDMKFKLDINLDDEAECKKFIAVYGSLRRRKLANLLGIAGTGSSKLATAFSNFAWNRATAFDMRRKGAIETALKYEAICDRIYSEEIQTICECW